MNVSQCDDCKLIVGDGPWTVYVQPDDMDYEVLLVMETCEGELHYGCDLADLGTLGRLLRMHEPLARLIAWDEFKRV